MDRATARKPRVLIVTGVLWIGGGAEKVAANLGNYFTDQGYEAHLLTFYEAPEKYPYHGIYHSFNESPKRHRLLKLFRVPWRIWQIAWYIKRHKIDVAYTFLEEANFYTLLAKLLFVRRVPVIVSVRNNIRQRGRLFRWLSARLYPKAHRVVSVTRVVEEMLTTDFGLTNTTTIYNSLDMPYISARAQAPLPAEYQWLHEQSPLLITIGRLIQQKGQWHMIRAFAEVVKTHPQATLVMLSEGEYRPQLESLIAACGLTDRVHLLGKHANVYQFLAAADLFVFTSLWEGMPNTMLEALSVGLPIITPDCPSGPREIIAPDVAVTDTPTYPLQTPYGTLLEPFPIAEPIWESPAHTPLTKTERVWAETVVTALTAGRVKGPQHTAHIERIEQCFTYEPIMQAWEQLLP